MTNQNMQKKIPIIIPYFRAPEELKKCKEAIEAQNYKPVEIFVHDNSENNILFTAAINKGLEKFAFDEQIDFVLVLNQDAYLSQNTLIHLVQTMISNPNCGIACPLQIDQVSGGVYWVAVLMPFLLASTSLNQLNLIKLILKRTGPMARQCCFEPK